MLTSFSLLFKAATDYIADTTSQILSGGISSAETASIDSYQDSISPNSMPLATFAPSSNLLIPMLFLSCASNKDTENSHTNDDCTTLTYYPDKDGDGYGNNNAKDDNIYNIYTCNPADYVPPDGYVAGNSDCDDRDSSTYPGADGSLNNCTDESDYHEPNENFNNAFLISCDEEIQADMGDDNDVDYYWVNLGLPQKIDIVNFYSPQELSANLYDTDYVSKAFDSFWVNQPAYIAIGFSDDSNGLNHNDPSYTFTLTCETCTEGEEYLTTCNDDAVVTYDECGNVVATEECTDPGDICYDAQCCNDTSYYFCQYDYSETDGEYRYMIKVSNQCYYDEALVVEVCDQGEDCPSTTPTSRGSCE